MPFKTPVRTALQEHPTSWGFWLTVANSTVARTLLASSKTAPDGGFSWVLVDAEHGLIADNHYYDLNQAVSSMNASPIIRIPWGEEWMIKRALDSGAHGILVPMCHTPEDAAKIVKYCKYPPTGTRGYGPLYSTHAFSELSAAEYDAGADKELVIGVQIESQSGVDNVEAIAKVDGLDMLLIGPFDLALQMGVTRFGPDHEAAIERIRKAAKDAGKIAAIFCTTGEQAKMRADQGFDMVSVITDVGLLGEAMARELNNAKGKGASGEKRAGY